jgi:RNA polymerase sigma-70 factor (ECF subfamily)
VPPTDAQLLARAHRDPAAYVAFYDRHERAVVAFVGGMVRDPDVTIDLDAETFARAYQSRRTFREADGARAWLLGIARHVVFASWRRGSVEAEARRRLEMQAIALTEEALAEVERTVLESEAAVVATWLADLPADQREAVRRRVLAEDDYATIAADLECSEAVVRQRVSRGLATLRRTWRQPR